LTQTTDVDGINKYLTWLRNIQLYPPQYSPEEYAEWVQMSEARGKMILIHKLLDLDLTDKEFRGKIKDIIEMEADYE
jgi:hypothetical protein